MNHSSQVPFMVTKRRIRGTNWQITTKNVLSSQIRWDKVFHWRRKLVMTIWAVMMIPFMLIMMIMITKDKFGGTSCFLRRTPAKAELRVCEKVDSCLGEYNDDDDEDGGYDINVDNDNDNRTPAKVKLRVNLYLAQ